MGLGSQALRFYLLLEKSLLHASDCPNNSPVSPIRASCRCCIMTDGQSSQAFLTAVVSTAPKFFYRGLLMTASRDLKTTSLVRAQEREGLWESLKTFCLWRFKKAMVSPPKGSVSVYLAEACFRAYVVSLSPKTLPQISQHFHSLQRLTFQ